MLINSHMKKLLQKINTKGVRSVVFGLVLTMIMGAGVSFVTAQNQTVEPFLGPASNLMSRIGSLAVGSSTVPSWIYNISDCVTAGHPPAQQKYTCLDVVGGGLFENLIVNQNGYILETATISTVGGYNPGTRGALGVTPTFVIEAGTGDGTNDSMLIQGLGRTSGATFNPIDTTTQRELCAAANGKIQSCSAGGAQL